MKSTAIIQNVHVSSRKAKLVVDLIRGKRVNEAIRILEITNKKSAPILKKLLNSAIANATNNHSMNAQSLYIYEIFANEGITMKRVMPRAKGSADTIFKRTTHFKIVLSDDINERKNDLQKIKDRIKKRAENNSKFKKDNNDSNLVVSKKENLDHTKVEKEKNASEAKSPSKSSSKTTTNATTQSKTKSSSTKTKKTTSTKGVSK